MPPLPDRTVILGMLITLGLVFALVFWFVRLAPSPEPALQWRDAAPLAPKTAPTPQQPVLPGRNGGDLI
jgi:energy-converting hydrogenase Eha subunit F